MALSFSYLRDKLQILCSNDRPLKEIVELNSSSSSTVSPFIKFLQLEGEPLSKELLGLMYERNLGEYYLKKR
jgi:hypothetical protein